MRLIYINSIDHNLIKPAKELSKKTVERQIIIKKRINSDYYSKKEVIGIVAEKLLSIISKNLT